MRFKVGLMLVLGLFAQAKAQTTTTRVEVYDLYSEDGSHFMRSVPFDNVEETNYGRTRVFGADTANELRTIERYFNPSGGPEHISLSNDGRSIACVNAWYYTDAYDSESAVVFYRDINLVRAYTAREITGCDPREKRCQLLYRNDTAVYMDRRSWVNGTMVHEFKESTPHDERFAIEHNAFTADDTLYLIDMDRRLHRFYLHTGEAQTVFPYDTTWYQYLSRIHRERRLVWRLVDAPSTYKLPPLRSGGSVGKLLARSLDMVECDLEERYKYKTYTIKVDGLLIREGGMQVLELTNKQPLSVHWVWDTLQAQVFDMDHIPSVFEQWRFGQYFTFRKRSKAVARKERGIEREQEHQAFLDRLVQDTLNGFYIPIDLADCLRQLDSLLTPRNQREMAALPDRNDMIRYHLGLGTGLRNQWYLWGGSRLQHYFRSRGITHPDEMSHVVLLHYWDWLHDQRETWKTWEQEHPVQH